MVRDSAKPVTMRGAVPVVLSLVLAVTSGCGDRASTRPEDAAGGQPGVAAAGQPGASAGSQSASIAGAETCTTEAEAAPSSVTGTIRGAQFEALVVEGGMATSFRYSGADGASDYRQWFAPTSDAADSPAAELEFQMPSDVVAASFQGWVRASEKRARVYSHQECGALTLDITRRAPSDVVCMSEYSPCDPGCRPSGELGLCVVDAATAHYRAWSGSPCTLIEPTDVGGWQLELTSVCRPYISGSFFDFQTHGHLSATLINNDDPTDTVTVSLDF